MSITILLSLVSALHPVLGKTGIFSSKWANLDPSSHLALLKLLHSHLNLNLSGQSQPIKRPYIEQNRCCRPEMGRYTLIFTLDFDIVLTFQNNDFNPGFSDISTKRLHKFCTTRRDYSLFSIAGLFPVFSHVQPKNLLYHDFLKVTTRVQPLILRYLEKRDFSVYLYP